MSNQVKIKMASNNSCLLTPRSASANKQLNTNAYSTIERIGRVFVSVQRHDNMVQGILYLRTTRGTKVSVLFCLDHQTDLLFGWRWWARQIFNLCGCRPSLYYLSVDSLYRNNPKNTGFHTAPRKRGECEEGASFFAILFLIHLMN